MTSRDFCYWLQGYFELCGTSGIPAAQAKCIQKHLALVFKHEIDPSAGSAAHQAELDKIHRSIAELESDRFDPSNTLIRC